MTIRVLTLVKETPTRVLKAIQQRGDSMTPFFNKAFLGTIAPEGYFGPLTALGIYTPHPINSASVDVYPTSVEIWGELEQNQPAPFVYGMTGDITVSGTGDIGRITGSAFSASYYGTGTVEMLVGRAGQVNIDGVSVVEEVRGVEGYFQCYSGGTLNKGSTLYARRPENFATVHNAYGVYIEDHSGIGDTQSYQIYSEGDGPSYLGGPIEGKQVAAPPAPPATGFIIYAEDAGGGKTRLMALFATGVAQQLALEP